ncbi:MAG: NAD(+) synthase, partial [Muribaculaceae bacterium]|nr:NAD(+) synthase [Muribaculaceae bacterium]
MKHGFFRAAACVPAVAVADVKANTAHIIYMIRKAEEAGADLAVFPELCVTGYTCGDLFHNSALLDAAQEALAEIAAATRGLHVAAVVGIPLRKGCMLLNCGALLADGACPLIRPKQYIPNYNEFYEKRIWRTGHGLPDERVALPGIPGSPTLVSTTALAEVAGVKIGIEVCEDLWVPIPPSSFQAVGGAEVIANLSASDDLIGKHAYLRRLIAQQSARCLCGYVYSSAGFGESSTDLVFDGKGFVAENGAILAETPRWSNDPQMVVRDIDIEALRHDRLHQGTFSDCARRLHRDTPETVAAPPPSESYTHDQPTPKGRGERG